MFLGGAIDRPAIHADLIKWKSDDPVWVDQWPLSVEKITAANQHVQEQLALGHITPSNSPWNSPLLSLKRK